jgi:hypothetical protein
MAPPSADAVHTRDVDLGDVAQVVSVGLCGGVERQVEVERPAASDDEVGDLGDSQGGGRGRPFACEERCERDGSCGVATLEQAHGAHDEAGEAACAGVATGVFLGHGGSGQDELARVAATVDLTADEVPDAGGFKLPFVDQLRRGAAEDEAGVDADGVEGGLVGVEVDLASRELFGSEGLAAGLGAL